MPENLNTKKTSLKRISISDIGLDFPDLKNINESKSVVIAKWLISFIKNGIKKGEISPNSILPIKAEFAYKFGVSIGTMQNAFRYVEDFGYVESKQCIGTIIRDFSNKKSYFKKFTTKRDLAVEAIKRYISSNNFKVGFRLPSSRTIATIIGYCSNTTRMALEYLSLQNIIEHRYKNAKDYGWVIKSLDFELNNDSKTKTLVESIVKEIKDYIELNLNIGDKLPSHTIFSQMFATSIKTVHDALKALEKEEIILSKRGRYGTTVIKKPYSGSNYELKPECSIFASASDTAFYYYEKTQNNIKRMIFENYEVGDKLPSIKELSKKMDLSPNTIRKAFHNLAREGYLVFSRGRYGGTFVIDIPEIESAAFQWIAVDPRYSNIYSKENAN